MRQDTKGRTDNNKLGKTKKRELRLPLFCFANNFALFLCSIFPKCFYNHIDL